MSRKVDKIKPTACFHGVDRPILAYISLGNRVKMLQTINVGTPKYSQSRNPFRDEFLLNVRVF